MKKIVVTLIAVLFSTFYISYAYSSSTYEDIFEQNINSAKLLEKHVVQLKKQLEWFKEKYNIEKDEKIDKTIYNLERMETGLIKIQNYKVEENLASNIIKNIVNELKNLNSDLWSYLKKIVDNNNTEVKKYREKYIKVIPPFSNNVKTIIYELATKIKSKDKLTSKDKQIIQSLKNMESYAKNLDRFSQAQFNTKAELKDYMIENISNIKLEITSIKKVITKKD